MLNEKQKLQKELNQILSFSKWHSFRPNLSHGDLSRAAEIRRQLADIYQKGNSDV